MAMDTSDVMEVLREAVGVAIKLAGPMLVLSMLVGVVVAIFQAVTQIHEQTLSFILKLVVVVAVLLIGGSWMLTTLQDYSKELFALIAG
jgi:flagellar biosynthetic protein FliQ